MRAAFIERPFRPHAELAAHQGRVGRASGQRRIERSVLALLLFLFAGFTARAAEAPANAAAGRTDAEKAQADAELQQRIEKLCARLGVPGRNKVYFPGGADPVYFQLTRIGKPAVPALKRVYRKGSSAAKREALYALGHMYDPDLRDFFLEATGDSDPRLARVAHWALIYLKDRTLIPFLLKHLADRSDPKIRGYAALALGKLGDKSVILPLRKALLIKDAARREVILALKELGAKEAVGDLIELYYTEPGFQSASLIVVAVAELDGRNRVNFLTHCLKNCNAAVVARALEALGRIGDPSCKPAIRRVLNEFDDPSGNVAPKAAATLYRLGESRALNVLKAQLDGRWPACAAAAIELAELQVKPATEVLLKKLASGCSSDPRLRRHILHFLGATGDESVLPVLVGALGKDALANYWAIQSIEKLTGLEFDHGWPEHTPSGQQQKAVEGVRAWWRRRMATHSKTGSSPDDFTSGTGLGEDGR